MKQKIYILGMISGMVLVTGAMFKVNHWPAAGILLTLGTLMLVFLFLPAALYDHYKAYGNRQNRPLYIVTYITCFVVFSAMLFKIMHWPYAGYLIMIAVPFPFVIFLPVWLFVTSKIEKFEINNTIFVLFLLALHAVFTALLSLNVTREKIYNSLEFSKDLYSLNTNIGNHPSDAEKSAVDLSADEVIKQIEECRQLLFNRVGITREGLNDGTCNDRYFDSRNIGQQVLLVSDKLSPAMKLEGSVRSFVSEIDKIPGYQDLAKRTTDILDLNAGVAEGKTWSELMFAEDYFSWVIVNLDAIENIVRVVKMSVFTNK